MREGALWSLLLAFNICAANNRYEKNGNVLTIQAVWVWTDKQCWTRSTLSVANGRDNRILQRARNPKNSPHSLALSQPRRNASRTRLTFTLTNSYALASKSPNLGAYLLSRLTFTQHAGFEWEAQATKRGDMDTSHPTRHQLPSTCIGEEFHLNLFAWIPSFRTSPVSQPIRSTVIQCQWTLLSTRSCKISPFLLWTWQQLLP